MPSHVTVRMTGQIGLDDVEELREYLARETDLEWDEESVPDGRHLSGLAETILIAVVANAAGRRADTALDMVVLQVREAARRWRDRWLDPPDIEVGTRDLPDTPETGDPADPQAPQAPQAREKQEKKEEPGEPEAGARGTGAPEVLEKPEKAN